MQRTEIKIMKTLFYGITGYTGELILEAAKKQELQPIIAGRNEIKVKILAKRFNLDFRVFDLENEENLNRNLADIDLLLHCAGPFHFTAEPMIKACLRNFVHYLDLSGRVEGFEYAASLNEQAKRQKIMLLPGVGFDVVPSDCLVAYLGNKMPDATHLTLAIAMKDGGISRGTALSSLENLPKGAPIRVGGKIENIPLASKYKWFTFGKWYKSLCVIAPWGDVSTAFYTANIPNVEAYLATSSNGAKMMQLTQKVKWLFKLSRFKNFAKLVIETKLVGPNESERMKSESYFYAEVSNAKKEQKAAVLRTNEAYTNTAQVAVHIVRKIQTGQYEIGFQTPGGLFGAALLLEIEGNVLVDI